LGRLRDTIVAGARHAPFPRLTAQPMDRPTARKRVFRVASRLLFSLRSSASSRLSSQEYPLMAQYISLNFDAVALVDDADYDRVDPYNWFLSGTGYAVGF